MTVRINPEQLRVIKKAFDEFTDSCVRTEAEKELQKDIINTLHETTMIDKGILRKLAKMYYARDGEEQKNSFEEIYGIYTSLR